MSNVVTGRLRGDVPQLVREILLNASGTLAMLTGGWLVAVNLGAIHASRSLVNAAVAVTVVIVVSAVASAWFAWQEGGRLLRHVRDVGVNTCANGLAAGLVWLLLTALGSVGWGQVTAVALLAAVAVPLLLWFAVAREVGVNLLCTVLVLGGTWALAVAQGAVVNRPVVTAAAATAVVLSAFALVAMVAVRTRHAGRTDAADLPGSTALTRTVGIALAANLVAAAAVGLALGAFGTLKIDHLVAFLALQVLVTPLSIALLGVAETLKFAGSHWYSAPVFWALGQVALLLFAAIVIGFPIAAWQLFGRPDFRGFAVLAVLAFALLLRAAFRREKTHGEHEKWARRLDLAVLVALMPVWTVVDFALAEVMTAPGTPEWVRNLILISPI